MFAGTVRKLQRVAIVGSAGRNEDCDKMTLALFTRAVDHALHIIQSKFRLATKQVILVSGGAACADHVAVALWLQQHQQFAGLQLHLPCQLVPMPTSCLPQKHSDSTDHQTGATTPPPVTTLTATTLTATTTNQQQGKPEPAAAVVIENMEHKVPPGTDSRTDQSQQYRASTSTSTSTSVSVLGATTVVSWRGVDTGARDWQSNPGRIMNQLHASFAARTGLDPFRDFALAKAHGAQVHDHYHGFHQRNSAVAQCEYLIAFTWGQQQDAPKEGGTRDTWNKCRGVKIHVRLSDLLQSQQVILLH